MDALETIGLKQYDRNQMYRDYYLMADGKLSFMEMADVIPQLRNVQKLRSDIRIPSFLKHYDIIGGINISSADALAAWDGKLKYYDSKLSLTVYEQYERAQDRIDFLGKWVLDENGAAVRVFDLLTEELKSANTGLYEKLKDPVSSVQALLEFNYTSSVVYNYYSAFDGSRKVVEYT